ncbi:MAG: hypothetical protein WDN00_18815 [Limisphaerales bacterium]
MRNFRASYSADVRRRHRWIRGDWQIATWLLPRLPGPEVQSLKNPLSSLSRWKIFDNLRRSLVPFALVFLLALGWVLFPRAANVWGLFIILLVALPSLCAGLTELLLKPKELPWSLHSKSIGQTIIRQAAQAVLMVVFLAHDAIISLDAVVRTLGRLAFTRRHLLEWQTTNEAERQHSGRLKSFFMTMCGAPLLAFGIAALLLNLSDPISWITLGFLFAWAASPTVAWWISLPLIEKKADLLPGQIRQLHKLARKTWNFFETFVNAENHWLPPDNFQEYPKPVVANRTSPTNIGLAVLGALSAHDFGYLSPAGLTQHLVRTLETLEKLERYQGHFYNWYDTKTLKPLMPLYISTVDNGNWPPAVDVHSGLLELTDQDWSSARIIAGLRDTLGVLKEQASDLDAMTHLETMGRLLDENSWSPAATIKMLDQLAGLAVKLAKVKRETSGEFENWRKIFEQDCRAQRDEIATAFPWFQLEEAFQTHLNRETAQNLKKFWEALNSPMSLRRRVDETKRLLARLDELLAAFRSSNQNTDLIKLLSDLRPLLDAAGQRALAGLNELENLARRLR